MDQFRRYTLLKAFNKSFNFYVIDLDLKVTCQGGDGIDETLNQYLKQSAA